MIAPSSAAGGDAPSPAVVIITVDDPGDDTSAQVLLRTVQDHLSGLPVRVILEKAPADGDPEMNAQVVVTVTDRAQKMSIRRVSSGEVVRRELSFNNQQWSARCERVAIVVLAVIEPWLGGDGDVSRAVQDQPSDSDGAGAPGVNGGKHSGKPSNSSPSAQTDPPGTSSLRLGVGLGLGAAFPLYGAAPSVAAGLGFVAKLPFASGRLGVETWLMYGRFRLQGEGTDPNLGDFEYTNRVFEMGLGLDVTYRFWPPVRVFSPYVGAGFLVEYIKTFQVSSVAGGTNTEWSFAPGGEAIAGVDLRVPGGYVFVEGRIVSTGLDQRMTGDVHTTRVLAWAGFVYLF